MSLPANITAIRSLIEYLYPNMPNFDLDNITEEWPDPNMDMIYPAMSIISKPIEYIPIPPQVISVTDIVGGENDGKYQALYNVGQYNLGIQVDIWCENKEDRGVFYEEFMDALNQEFINSDLPTGASISLIDYHNSIARYDIIGYNYPDDGNSSQIGEFRVKIDLVANFMRIKEVIRSKMATIVLEDEISDDVDIN